MPEILSIHEAQEAPKRATSAVEQQDRSVAKMVNRLLTRSKRATENLRADWPQNYDYVVKGKQWPLRRPRYRFSEVVNLTWANIMTEVALQTDSRPSVDFTPTEPSDIGFVEVMKKINEVNWKKGEQTGHGWQRKISTAIFKSKLYHVVHAEVAWDPEMANGLGDISMKILNPYGCFWDPLATNIFECRYFIFTEVVPTSQLRKEYPEHKDKIQPDVNQVSPGQSSLDDHDIDLFWKLAETGQRVTEANRGEDILQGFGGEEMSFKIRCWLKDDTVEMIKEEKTNEDGSIEIEELEKKVYPNGRYIVVHGNTVLEDRENGYKDGLFPIARLVNYDYGEYAGENEVTHQRGPNNIVNYSWSHILDQMKQAGNPINVWSNQDAKAAKKATNEPGSNYVVSDPQKFRREPGVGIAAGMFNILESGQSIQDKIQGLQDVSRGAPQPGVTSGLMLEGFVEAAQTRPRMKNRSLEEFLMQIGYLMASRYLQFYKQPRVFRITGDPNFPEFVSFHVEDVDDGQGNITQHAVVQDMTKPGNITHTEIKGLPDIEVQTGSSLPFARAMKTSMALQLFDKGVLTGESLLKAINWPNAEEEIEKVRQEQAQLAQMQGAQNG